MSYSRIVYTPRDLKRRRRSFSKKGFFIFLIVCGVIGVVVGVGYLLRIPRLQITKISVDGVSTLTRDEVVAVIHSGFEGNYFGVLPRTNFFLVRSGRVAEELVQAFPVIRSIQVTKTFPDRMGITIVERTLWGIACNDLQAVPDKTPECAYIDDSGFAYERSPASYGSLIIRVRNDLEHEAVPGQLLEPSFVTDAIAMRTAVERTIGARIVTYEFSSKLPREITLETAEGFKIIFPRGVDIDATATVLKRVFEQEIKNKRSRLDYVDVRFGNKVFFKLKNG